MNNSKLKGIAVILFGILLSTSSAEINRTVLASFGDFPYRDNFWNCWTYNGFQE